MLPHFFTLLAMLQMFLYGRAVQRVLMWTKAWAENDPGFPQPNTNTKIMSLSGRVVNVL